MKSEKVMYPELLTFGNQNDEVRAILLTSSRTNNAFKDVFTDYDVELFVQNLDPFLKSDKWINNFGTVITTVPLKAIEKGGWITRLVMYEDGTKIDFQISTIDTLNYLSTKLKLPDDYDNGYKVLLDKDNVTNTMQLPTYTAFIIQKPTKDEYEELINDFWWDTTYVAKNLWRDELYYAKFSLDSVIRFNYLQKLIEWYIGLKNNWQVTTNKYGRWFKRYLDKKTWEELESTFVGAKIEENWDALFKIADLFRRLSLEIGSELGYSYPSQLEKKIRTYWLNVKQTRR